MTANILYITLAVLKIPDVFFSILQCIRYLMLDQNRLDFELI